MMPCFFPLDLWLFSKSVLAQVSCIVMVGLQVDPFNILVVGIDVVIVVVIGLVGVLVLVDGVNVVVIAVGCAGVL